LKSGHQWISPNLEMKVCTKQRINSSTFLTANAICFQVTGEIKKPISTRSDLISCFPVQAHHKSALVVDLEKWALKAVTCSG